VYLYSPDMFRKHEEVIVFNRDEFNRTYNSLEEQIDHINKANMHLDKSEEWKLMEHWPKIMEKAHILDVILDSALKKEPLQCYMDAYLYDIMEDSKENVRHLGKRDG